MGSKAHEHLQPREPQHPDAKSGEGELRGECGKERSGRGFFLFTFGPLLRSELKL
jgi:hypothetical protein